jgi:predicted house-cleaning noncanonical NTP pyrophosphatase (MazG superfamily)
MHKLVRDEIPLVMAERGVPGTFRELGADEFVRALEDKLGEEVREYQVSHDLEELADLVEVVLALVEVQGSSVESFEQLRLMKRATLGGFTKRLLLVKEE